MNLLQNVLSIIIAVVVGILSNFIATLLHPHLEKKKRFYIGLFVTLVLGTILMSINFPSCNIQPPKSNTVVPLKSGSMILVLCDLSPSQSSTNINTIVRLSNELIHACNYCEMAFYPISNNLYVPCLQSFKPGSRRLSDLAQIRKNTDSLQNKILNIYRQQSDSGESCILRGLDMTFNKFNQDEAKSKASLNLIIMSDMMEYCNYDSGKIDLRNPITVNNIISANESHVVTYNLAELNVKIYVVITSSNALPIDPKLHRKFWNSVFKKYGYSDSAVNKIIFDTELPKICDPEYYY